MPSSTKIHHFQVETSQQGMFLLHFIKQQMDLSGSKTKALLDNRAVWVNKKRIWMAKHRLSVGDHVEIRTLPDTPKPAHVSLEVLWKDDWIIAVNKPPGLISESHPRSVESLLRTQLSKPQLRALHRLDKPTSGILLFTTTSSIREEFITLFKEKAVEKYYAVLVAGIFNGHKVEVNTRVDGKEAHSLFIKETQHQGCCRATCQITTGRTHQIRRHLESIHCRVLGDTRYQKGPAITQQEKKLPRHMLHAEKLTMSSPYHKNPIALQAPWPKDFTETANIFGLT